MREENRIRFFCQGGLETEKNWLPVKQFQCLTSKNCVDNGQCYSICIAWTSNGCLWATIESQEAEKKDKSSKGRFLEKKSCLKFLNGRFYEWNSLKIQSPIEKWHTQEVLYSPVQYGLQAAQGHHSQIVRALVQQWLLRLRQQYHQEHERPHCQQNPWFIQQQKKAEVKDLDLSWLVGTSIPRKDSF